MAVTAWQADMFGDGQAFRASWDNVIQEAVERVGGFKAQTDAEKNEENRRILAEVVVSLPWVVNTFEEAVRSGNPQVGLEALREVLWDERRFPGTDTLARNIRLQRENGNGEVATPSCPKCGSNKTTLESSKGSVGKYVCRSCWKRFSKVS